MAGVPVPYYSQWCTGGVVITVTQKACVGPPNQSSCVQVANDLFVTYGAANDLGVPFGGCNGIGCVQDLTSRVAIPGGTNC